MVRLTLLLAEKADWQKVFDPRGGTVFVPIAEPPEVGEDARVDVTVEPGGPRVILKGTVAWRRAEAPTGCAVSLSAEDREKINFVNGYVRGGLLNRRERRRLPLRLPVTYGSSDGPRHTFCRDINEDGIFIVSEDPLPEQTVIHFFVTAPGEAEPIQLKGVVQHTVIVEDEDVPGMGIRYQLDSERAEEITRIVDALERAFMAGSLPDDVIS